MEKGVTARKTMATTKRARGWGATEYLAVLLGLIAVWKGGQLLLALIREHHDEYAWALTVPF
jgi:hypothetical protein